MGSRLLADGMTVARRSMPRHAATASFCLLLMTLAVGVLVPVYTDEVAWRFQLSRYLVDGGVDRATGETCGANTWAQPATFMLPVRWFSSSVTRLMLGPLSVRLTGVALAIVAMFGIRTLIRRNALDVRRRAHIELTVFGLLGLGVLPFLLVWSRPEQPILLALLACLLLALPVRSDAVAPPRNEAFVRVVAIVMIAMIALSYHLKGLFYLPVFVMAVALTGGRRWRIRRWAIVVLICAAVLAYRYWATRFACPDDPILAEKLGRENAAVMLLRGGFMDVLWSLPRVLGHMLPKGYIRPIVPGTDYMSQWLPRSQVAPLPLALWGWGTAIVWWGAFALAGVLLVRAARDRARDGHRFLLGLVVLGCVTAWAGLQINKNAYESALYLPMAAMAIVFLWIAVPRDAGWLGGVAVTIAILSAASQVALIASYAAPLWAAGQAGGYIADQPYSLSAFSYPRTQILAAAAKCGIVPHPALRRVLIDDLTYFAFADSRLPLHRSGVLSQWAGSTGDPMIWLHRHASPGAVLACAAMPRGMRAKAIASGSICCVDTR